MPMESVDCNTNTIHEKLNGNAIDDMINAPMDKKMVEEQSTIAHDKCNGTNCANINHYQEINEYSSRNANHEKLYHPLLRGGQPPFPHSFTKSQMKVFTAIADTLFPSLKDCHEINIPANVKSYNELSASDMEVPIYAAGMLCKLLRWTHFLLVYITLALLSTRVGTLFLCGFSCFVKEFPYLQSFPELPITRRDQILGRWASSRFLLFQAIFKIFKSVIAWNCFAKADGNGFNPTWEALGFYLPKLATNSESCNTQKPLEGKVIDLNSEPYLCEKLRKAGFWAHEGKSYLEPLVKKRRRSFRNPNPENGLKDVTVRCDAVVVGSGAGGGVISGLLAKAGMKVLVIEKGDYFARGDYSHIEASSAMAMLEGPNHLVTENGSMIIKAGATVGGGTTVNWAAALPTPDHVLKEWAEEHKLSLFGDEKYKLAMDSVLKRINARVGSEKESLQNSVLRQGCKKLGLHVHDVACNAVGEHFCGRCEQGCSTGAKQSTAETWLVDATAHGAAILASCTAKQVIHVGGTTLRKKRRAVGIYAVNSRDGHRKIYVEARVVVAAGGALQTPPLLRRSGLRNRHIGRNLHLHPTVMAWGYLPKCGADDDGRIFEGGIITQCCKDMIGGIADDGYGAILQSPALMPGAFSFQAPWVSGRRFKQFMSRYSRTCVIFALLRDRTAGSVAEGYGKQSVRVNYSLSKSDRATALRGVEHALRILAAVPGMQEVGLVGMNGESCRSDEIDELVKRVRERGVRGLDYSLGSAHQMGTCRMGAGPEVSAVDENCETWEVEGLFVGDSSVFPSALGVNPMVTIQTIAFCTAQNIISSFLQIASQG